MIIKSRIRRRWMSVVAVPAAAVVAVTGMALPANASSHREAPLISQDPVADNTDLYMFKDSNDPTKLNIVANYVGLEQPQGGPNYAKFGDDVLYQIHLDNNGDVADDITYNFRFRTTIANSDTFLYNTGQITAPNGANQNVQQTYSVERVDAGGSHMLATDVVTPPVNVGVRSTPNYESALATPAIKTLNDGAKSLRWFTSRPILC